MCCDYVPGTFMGRPVRLLCEFLIGMGVVNKRQGDSQTSDQDSWLGGGAIFHCKGDRRRKISI